MTTVSGLETMIAELDQDSELFQELDLEVNKFSEPYHLKMGFPNEIADSLLEDIRQGDAAALESLHDQRFPKKWEKIVKVFKVPLARISHKPIAKSRRIWHNCVSTQAVTDQTKRLSL
jgi:hypothetical protein